MNGTPLDFVRKLDRIITALQTDNKPFKQAVQDIHVMRMRRIFQQGEKADGSPIGSYSTRPFYMNPKNSPKKFSGKGKNDKRSNKTHATRYFAGGYKEFRGFIGRPNTHVDLGLTYDLRFDISNSKNLNSARPDKISNNEYQERIKRPLNLKKLNGIEDKYGNVFGFSQKERSEFQRIFNFYISQLLNK